MGDDDKHSRNRRQKGTNRGKWCRGKQTQEQKEIDRETEMKRGRNELKERQEKML